MANLLSELGWTARRRGTLGTMPTGTRHLSHRRRTYILQLAKRTTRPRSTKAAPGTVAMGASRKLERATCVVAALFLSSASAWARWAPPQQMQLPQLPQPLPNNTMVAPQLPATPAVPSALWQRRHRAKRPHCRNRPPGRRTRRRRHRGRGERWISRPSPIAIQPRAEMC
jgi:hypothetical protein